MAKKRIYSVLLALLITVTGFGTLFTGTEVHATQNKLGASLGASEETTVIHSAQSSGRIIHNETYEYTIYRGDEGVPRNFLFPDGKDLGESIFTNAQLTINGVEVSDDIMLEYQDGMQIEIVYDWEIADEVELEYADWARIKVPDIFHMDGFLVGTLYFENEEIGSYYLDEDNYLLMVFNEVLVDKEQRKGQAGFALEFVLKEFADDTVQQVEFGGSINKSFTIGLKPTGESSKLVKGLQKLPEINATTLEWFVDINTTLNTLTDGKVVDSLPEGLQLEEDSIEILELSVGFEGKLTEGSPALGFTPQITDNGFEINLGETNKAYRIKYRTQISDSSIAEYKNEAYLYDKNEEIAYAEFVVEAVQRGRLIEKSGVADDDNFPSKISWTIDVNQAEMHLEDVAIHDELLHDGLTIVPQSIHVYELVKKETGWEMGADVSQEFLEEKSFPIALGDLHGTAYRIVFDTEIAFKSYEQENVLATLPPLRPENKRKRALQPL